MTLTDESDSHSPLWNGAGFALLLAGILLASCARTRTTTYSVAPWLRADPRRCLLQRDLRDGIEDMARRCAEVFVSENGYTVYPPSADSSRWVTEGAGTEGLRRIIAARFGMLMPEGAWVQCVRRECRTFFRLREPTRPCTFRSVRMSYVFTRMSMETVLTEVRHCRQKPV
ncbi:MAG: hypothetical protein ABJD11_02320 [Gemmatimonadota bacterium]